MNMRKTLKVRLISLRYVGANIGQNWVYKYEVGNSRGTLSFNLKNGGEKKFNQELTTMIVGKEMWTYVPIVIYITEKDPKYDDLGAVADVFSVLNNCPRVHSFYPNGVIIGDSVGDKRKLAIHQMIFETVLDPNWEDLIAFITKWEDRKKHVYPDSEGIKTIGVGFNLERRGAKKKIKQVGADYEKVINGEQDLTDAQIDELLRPDVEQAIEDARKRVEKFDCLPIEAQFVIIDMNYNLGGPKFSRFQKAIKAFENGDFEEAAKEMKDSKWFKQTGRRSEHHVHLIAGLKEQE